MAKEGQLEICVTATTINKKGTFNSETGVVGYQLLDKNGKVLHDRPPKASWRFWMVLSNNFGLLAGCLYILSIAIAFPSSWLSIHSLPLSRSR